MLSSCRVVIAQWSEHRQLYKFGGLGLILSGCLFFSLSCTDLPPVALPTVLTTSDKKVMVYYIYNMY